MAYTPKVWKNNSSGNTPITAAELNRMEEGIQEALQNSGLEFITMKGSRYSNCEYAVFRQAFTNSGASDFTAPYFYILEGWAKCYQILEGGNAAEFGFSFEGLPEDVMSGLDMFYDNGYATGTWYSVLESAQLGYLDRDDYAFRQNEYANPMCKSPLVNISMGITSWGSGSLGQHFLTHCTAAGEPITGRTYFSQEDIDAEMVVRFRLKLLPISQGGVG